MEKVGAQISIKGKVQGVFYRLETQKAAKKLGVSGWVRNQPDGTVAVLAEGQRADVEALIVWCQTGSPMADVSKVDVEWAAFSGRHHDFKIVY